MTDLDRRCGRIRRDELPHSIAFEQTAQEKIAVEKAENLLARSGDVIAQQEQMIAGMNTFVTESMSDDAKKKLAADGEVMNGHESKILRDDDANLRARRAVKRRLRGSNEEASKAWRRRSAELP